MPCRVDTMAESEALRTIHAVLVVVYFPIWYLDYMLLDGPHWASPPLEGVTE